MMSITKAAIVTIAAKSESSDVRNMPKTLVEQNANNNETRVAAAAV